MTKPLLEFRQISKAYGPLFANRDISFQVQQGQIHALIGENGAGKSTLMRILFGLEKPTSGEIYLRGARVEFQNPNQAKACGFGMVEQHFKLAAALSALDHVLLEEPRKKGLGHLFGPLDRKSCLAKLQSLEKKYSMPLDWHKPIRDLSVGLQQRLEILKLLAYDTELLILDEPTAVLTPAEIEQFLIRLTELKASGKTIILITHKLHEVLQVADWITVLRQGQVVSSFQKTNQTKNELASLMVGHNYQPLADTRTTSASEVGVQVQDLCTADEHSVRLQKVSFDIYKKEILGVAGVHGNGQSELLRALIHPLDTKLKVSGQIKIGATQIQKQTTAEIKKMGVGLIGEDRLRQSVAASLSAKENFLLGRFDLLEQIKVDGAKLKKSFEDSVHKFEVRPNNPELALQSYSGGNQQKIVVARELGANPQFLIVAEPTRGVDIGASQIIHQALLSARENGMSQLLISSDLDELMQMSDRIIVMSKGKVLATISRENFNREAIGALMGGEK